VSEVQSKGMGREYNDDMSSYTEQFFGGRVTARIERDELGRLTGFVVIYAYLYADLQTVLKLVVDRLERIGRGRDDTVVNLSFGHTDKGLRVREINIRFVPQAAPNLKELVRYVARELNM